MSTPALETERLLKAAMKDGCVSAVALKHTAVTSEHLLLGILQRPEIKAKFGNFNISAGSISNEITMKLVNMGHFLKEDTPNLNPHVFNGKITHSAKVLLDECKTKADEANKSLSLYDILRAMINDDKSWGSYFLRKHGLTYDMITEIEQKTTADAADAPFAKYCVNLNERMKDSTDPIIGRTKELFSIAHTLSKKKKCNVLMVGDPGIGKTMVAEGLAQRIISGDVPDTLKDKVVYSLDIGSVLAGCKYRGDFEEKIRAILDELIASKVAILFIDEAHTMDAGESKGSGGLGFSSMLKPELARGTIKVIATTTWEGYRQTFEKDHALMRRFRVLQVGEPSLAETLEILEGIRSSMEAFHKVKISHGALQTAVDLTVKYQKDKRLPDKAIDIIDSACARNRVIDMPVEEIGRAEIVREVSDVIGMPIKSEEEHTENTQDILNAADEFKKVVYNQEPAIDRVSKSLIIAQSGLKDPNKPIAGFLFMGKSGVGKTMLARQIAKKMGMGLIKFDMSEFQEKHSVARLIGAPPGYVGYGDGGSGEGELINAILKNPNSVLLLDEVEKAHPDIFTVLLQILEDGEASGSTGKKGDFRNAIVIMSSNLGTGAKKALGFNTGSKSGKSASDKAVADFFLTEVRGRIKANGAIIEFNDLDEVSYRRIVVEDIQNLAALVSNRKLKIVPGENLVSHILELNKDSEYGARNIASLVGDIIKFPLATALLKGTISNNSTVNLDWVAGELRISQEIHNLEVAVDEMINVRI